MSAANAELTSPKRTPLTDSAISKGTKDAKALGREIKLTDWDASAPGLHIRLSPKGTRTWSLRCRNPTTKKMQTARLGIYPTMGISDARKACRVAHMRVKEGVNLTAERRAKRAAASQPGQMQTLSGLLDAYAAHAPKSFAKNRGAIERVYAPLLDKPLSELSKTAINLTALEYGQKHEVKHYPNLAHGTLKPALKWAVDCLPGFDQALVDISKPYKVPPRRKRWLSDDELGKLLPHLTASDEMHAKAIKFILLTATRLDEVCRATWREFDMSKATWTVGGERRKSTNPEKPAEDHVLDLPKQAMSMLLERAKKPHKTSDYVFPNSNGSPLSNWDKSTKKIHTETGTSNWHRHDLRRTTLTALGDLGYHTDVTEASAGHMIGDPLSSRYNQSRYRKVVKEALQVFADHLDAIERVAKSKADKKASQNQQAA